MKKIVSLLLLLVMVMGLLPAVGSVAAQSGVTDLAQYFPNTTVAFFAMRTDDAFIDDLDSIVSRIAARIPPELAPFAQIRPLREELDRAMNGEFTARVRPILGDSVAIGVPTLDATALRDEPPFLIAVDITDRGVLETLLDEEMDGDYEKTTEGNVSLWNPIDGPSSDFPAFLLTDDVWLISDIPSILSATPRERNLANDEVFTSTLDLLPADDYRLLGYYNAEPLVPLASMMIPAQPGVDPGSVVGVLGSGAVGFSILDDRALVVDFAVNYGDMSDLESLGLTMSSSTTPVNADFLRHLPANAQYVWHATDLKGMYDGFLTNARALAALDDQDLEQFDQGLAMFDLAVNGMLGLNFEEDILGWMTEDFVLYFGMDNAFYDAVYADPSVIVEMPELPFDLGFLVRVTDPVAARGVMAQLSDNLPTMLVQANATEAVILSQETINGGDVLVLTAPLPDEDAPLPALEVLFGVNDEVFVIGTRGAVTAALAPSAGLADAPAFVEAQDYMVENAVSTVYVSPEGIQTVSELFVINTFLLGPAVGNVFDEIVTELEASDAATLTPEEVEQQEQERQDQQQRLLQEALEMRQQVNSIFGVMESISISSGWVDDSAILRLAILLAP